MTIEVTMHEEFMFALPMLKFSLSDWQNKKRQLLDLVDWDDPRCKTSYYYSDFGKNLDADIERNHPYREQMVSMLDKELYMVKERVGSDLFMDEVWAQRYYKSHFMPPHNHGAIGLSAILYVEYDATIHTPTSFYCPYGSFNSGQIEVFEPQVKEGDLIIFPSLIMHAVIPFTSNKGRTVFSFNLCFK